MSGPEVLYPQGREVTERTVAQCLVALAVKHGGLWLSEADFEKALGHYDLYSDVVQGQVVLYAVKHP